MISIARYCLICAFLCKSFTSNADTIVSNFRIADSIYQSGNFDKAALEYERIIFLSKSDNERSKALLCKSYCFKKLNRYDEAMKTLQCCNSLAISDSIKYIINKEQCLVAYLSENFTDALTTLNILDQTTPDSNKRYEYLYLNILVLNELQKWNEATDLLKKYMYHHNIDPYSGENRNLFERPKLLNPRTAKILSYIIPGSGQIYSGHIFRGFTSLIFQGSALTYTILSIQKGYYLSGIFTGLGLFQMFYTGGSRYAEYLVRKENAKKITAYNKKIKDFILTQESQ